MIRLARQRRLQWTAGLLGLIALLALITAAGLAPPLEDAASSLFGPVQRAFRQAGEPISELVAEIEDLGRLEGENRALRQRIAQLEAENARFREEEIRRPGRLALLELIGASSGELLPANVITRDLTGLRTVIGIDRGANDGVAAGMPAVAAGGALVGVVTDARANTAFVRLVTDPDSAVRVLHQVSRTEVVAEGDTLGNLAIAIPWTANVELGQMFVTSGLEGLIPYGLPLGRAVAASGTAEDPFQRVRLQPVAPLEQLGQVLIQTSAAGRRATEPAP